MASSVRHTPLLQTHLPAQQQQSLDDTLGIGLRLGALSHEQITDR